MLSSVQALVSAVTRNSSYAAARVLLLWILVIVGSAVLLFALLYLGVVVSKLGDTPAAGRRSKSNSPTRTQAEAHDDDDDDSGRRRQVESTSKTQGGEGNLSKEQLLFQVRQERYRRREASGRRREVRSQELEARRLAKEEAERAQAADVHGRRLRKLEAPRQQKGGMSNGERQRQQGQGLERPTAATDLGASMLPDSEPEAPLPDGQLDTAAREAGRLADATAQASLAPQPVPGPRSEMANVAMVVATATEAGDAGEQGEKEEKGGRQGGEVGRRAHRTQA